MGGTTTLRANYRFITDRRFARVRVLGTALALSSHYEYVVPTGAETIGMLSLSPEYLLAHVKISGVARTLRCVGGCSKTRPYYRSYEGNPGCAFIAQDPDEGRVLIRDGSCARMIPVFPADLKRRFGRVEPAQVAAITVCQERVGPNQNPGRLCPGKLPL